MESCTRRSSVGMRPNSSYQNGVTVKEGETKQIISAADRNTGEVVKVDVTLILDK